MKRYEVKTLVYPKGERTLSGGPVEPIEVVRNSRTLRGADLGTAIAAILGVLTFLGVFTPEQSMEVQSQIGTLTELVERAFTAVFAAIAAGAQLFRYLRLAFSG